MIYDVLFPYYLFKPQSLTIIFRILRIFFQIFRAHINNTQMKKWDYWILQTEIWHTFPMINGLWIIRHNFFPHCPLTKMLFFVHDNSWYYQIIRYSKRDKVWIKRLSLLDVKRRSEILFWCKKLWLVSLNFVSTCTKWDLTASTLLFQNVISKIEFV